MNKLAVGTVIWLVGLIGMLFFLLNSFVKFVDITSGTRTIIFAVCAAISVVGAFIRSSARK